ncbi:MAG: STAS domain-containing protein [bacterium]
MKLHHRKEKEAWILTPEGRLDAQTVAEFKKTVGGFLKEEEVRIVFDFRHVDFIDSTGLGALISILRKIESKNGSMRLFNLSKEVESIFEITRLHKLFKISPHLEHAIEGCRS